MHLSSTHSSLKESLLRIAASQWKSIALICALALTLRVAVALWLPAEVVWQDGHRYERVADNLLEGRGFGSLTNNRMSVPTQPLLIAAVKRVFGNNYVALRLAFAVLGAAICGLGYVLGRMLFAPAIGLIAGVLLATYPFYVYMSALFEYPQTFFIFITVVAFVLLYRFLDTGRLLSLFASGLAFGLGILTVPTMLIFLPLLLISLWSPSALNTVSRVLVVLIGVTIPVGSWATRNYIAYGEPILVNKASGINFWVANNETYYQYGKESVVLPCPPGFKNNTYCAEGDAQYRRLSASNLTELQFVNADERASWDNGLKFISDFPKKFAVLTARKIWEFWSPDPDAVNHSSAQGGSFRIWLARLSYLPMLAFAVVGIGLSIKRSSRRMFPVIGFFLAMSVPYYVFLPSTRYRLPLDFFLILFASVALAHLIGANHALSSKTKPTTP